VRHVPDGESCEPSLPAATRTSADGYEQASPAIPLRNLETITETGADDRAVRHQAGVARQMLAFAADSVSPIDAWPGDFSSGFVGYT
jgi:hypothetical protein